jgi:lipopolysaccharide/colanic/teichoic acid biosynthesis glycosyltransferase
MAIVKAKNMLNTFDTPVRKRFISKRLIDLFLGIPCFFLLVPVILLIAFAVRLESVGNPFFIQTRIGRNGRPFQIFKIRTLYLEHFGILGREEEPEDFRITKVGKFLRRSKLDELPQLLNVILGHMTLVGPRPDIPSQVAMYTVKEFERLAVKPGVTGITQISGNTSLSWADRVRLDIWYIENWSLLLDLKIISLTASAIYKGETINADPFNLHVQ